MTSTGFVGIEPAAARQLASDVAAWDGEIDHIVSLINQAEALSDVPSNAALRLFEIASDGRSIARAITSAADQIESHILTLDTPFTLLPLTPDLDLGFEPGMGLANTPRALRGEAGLQTAIETVQRDLSGVPIGPARSIDANASSLEEVRLLLERSDQLAVSASDIPEYMDYAKSDLEDEAAKLRQQALDQIVAMGQNPALIIGALMFGQASSLDIVRTLELQQAQALHGAAENLLASDFALERDQMQQDATDILHNLFLTAEAQEIITRFSGSVAPYDIVALIAYAEHASDGGLTVFDSHNPARVLQVIAQGYTEAAAIALVDAAPSTGLMALTILELEARLAHLEANHGENTAEFDATLAALNDRTQSIGGDIYVRVGIEAVRAAEMLDLSYGDALAAIITLRLETASDHPGAHAAQMAAIQIDLERLVGARYLEEIGTEPEMLPMAPERKELLNSPPDQVAEAIRLLAIIGTGAGLALAEALSGVIPANASPGDAARITRQIISLTASDTDLDSAAQVAIAAFVHSIDLAAVTTLAADEGIDLASAFELVVNAERRAMTVDEYHAYIGFTDPTTFDIIDTIQGGDADGKVSLADIEYTIANADRLGIDAEVVAAAQAFKDHPELMARIDTASNFIGNVVSHEPFGRDHFDDVVWSRADIELFELKQNINFALAGTIDLIDTADEGGNLDGHLSKGDFQTVLDNAEELELSDAEIAAITTVIDGRLYDQHWIEQHRDSIALAAAVLVGTAIFIATLGTGAPISVGLVGSVAASAGGAAIAGGTATTAINAFTQEELDDGVAVSTIKSGLIGGASAPGLAGASAGWGTASLLEQVGIVGSLTGEATGLIGHGALDWAIDTPLTSADEIDLANIHADYTTANLLLNANSPSGFVLQVATNVQVSDLQAAADATPSIAADPTISTVFSLQGDTPPD